MNDFDLEITDAKLEKAKEQKLNEIKDALKPSGVVDCQSCGAPIEEARLKVLPSARRCIRCAKELEGR